MRYEVIDRFTLRILVVHFGILVILCFTNSYIGIARMMPSPFSRVVISGHDAWSILALGAVATIMPFMLRKRLKDHYQWRILLTICLLGFSYLYLAISGGTTEMRAHFLLIMAYMSVYLDWRLEWIAFFLSVPEWIVVFSRNPLAPLSHGLSLSVMTLFTSFLCRNHREVLMAHKEIERKKDEFISIASHELKTPITTIKGFTQIMQRSVSGSGDRKFTTYLGKMNEQLDRLTKLINDLLNVSKIRAGKLELHRESFDIDALIRTTVEEAQEASPTHKIVIGGRAKIEVMADKYRIAQVLTNLLSNAVKYSPHADTIAVSAFTENGNVIIGVRDHGPGIPAEQRLHIFEPFYQLDNPERASFSGLGLGLYISAQIMRRHQGDIWVESDGGTGSIFYISLPVQPVS